MFKEIKHKELTGSPSEVFNSINRSLGHYKTWYKYVKIGITGRPPENRFKEHLRDRPNWYRMDVLYKTSSPRYANKLENMLVKHHKEYVLNSKPGGGSNLTEEGDNYLYVLLGN